MKAPQDIIISPVITERSSAEQANGRYTFYVSTSATKPEIRAAVEKLFGVKVLGVNTTTVQRKTKRVRFKEGRTAERKKAMVKIAQDPKASVYTTKGGKATTAAKKYKSSIDDFGFGQ